MLGCVYTYALGAVCGIFSTMDPAGASVAILVSILLEALSADVVCVGSCLTQRRLTTASRAPGTEYRNQHHLVEMWARDMGAEDGLRAQASRGFNYGALRRTL
jgi:hypothetical protein